MLLNKSLIQQFGNLPYLSKIEIIKYLDHYELLKMTIISNGWVEVVEPFLKKEENKKEIAITLETFENSAEITVSKHAWREKAVRLSIDFFMNSTDRIELKAPELITIHSQNAKTHQFTILSTIRLFRSLFQVVFHRIHLNFDFGYSVKFLGSLELEKFESVSWLDLEAEKVRVNGAELGKILEKFDVYARRKLNIKTMRNWKGGEYLLRRSIELDDSKWITGKMLVEKFNSPTGIFRNCRFSEADYNLFLQKFKNREKSFRHLKFFSEKPLNLKEIIKNLDAEPWDPSFRSRKKHIYNPLVIFDLADGWDFVTKSGKLGTVLLSENQKVLQFHWWQKTNFPLPRLKKTLVGTRERMNEDLSCDYLTTRERECYQKDVVRLAEEIRYVTEEMRDNL